MMAGRSISLRSTRPFGFPPRGLVATPIDKTTKTAGTSEASSGGQDKLYQRVWKSHQKSRGSALADQTSLVRLGVLQNGLDRLLQKPISDFFFFVIAPISSTLWCTPDRVSKTLPPTPRKRVDAGVAT